MLTFLVSLGFLAGTLLRKPLLAAVVLVFVWYPIGIVLNAFSLEEFSPISLSRAMTTQLRQPWHAADGKSKASAQDMEALARQMDHFLSVFSNGKPKPAPKPDFFEGGGFTRFLSASRDPGLRPADPDSGCSDDGVLPARDL